MNLFAGERQGLCGFCPSEETFCQPSNITWCWCLRLDCVTIRRSGFFELWGTPKSQGFATFPLNENSMGNLGITIINHPTVITIDRWYSINHSQSWVVYGIVIPTLPFFQTTCREISCTSLQISTHTMEKTMEINKYATMHVYMDIHWLPGHIQYNSLHFSTGSSNTFWFDFRPLSPHVKKWKRSFSRKNML